MRKIMPFLLLAMLVSLACQRGQTELASAARADLQRLPAASHMVFYCDVDKVTHSPLAEEVLQQLEKHMQREVHDRDFAEFKAATGFDPRRDVHTVLVGAAPLPDSARRFGAIVRGRFDEQRLRDYVKQKAAEEHAESPWREETVGAYTLYIPHEKDGDMAFCFADSTTLYVGERAWLTALLQNEKPESRGIKPAMLAALQRKLRYGDQFWFALELTEEMKKSHHLPAELRHNFPKAEDINAVAFSARVDKGLAFEGQVECGKAETSKLLTEALRGGLAAAKLSVAADRPTVDALNSIAIEQKDNKMVMHGELSEQFFNKLREQKLFIWDEKFAQRRPHGEI